ncbi:hypothetical protein MBTS_22605 [Methylobacterium bullatum]|nr:hypothetical protein [Methylobacterium bullatum]
MRGVWHSPSPRLRGEGFGPLAGAETRRQPRVRGGLRTSLFRGHPLTLAAADAFACRRDDEVPAALSPPSGERGWRADFSFNGKRLHG